MLRLTLSLHCSDNICEHSTQFQFVCEYIDYSWISLQVKHSNSGRIKSQNGKTTFDEFMLPLQPNLVYQLLLIWTT